MRQYLIRSRMSLAVVIGIKEGNQHRCQHATRRRVLTHLAWFHGYPPEMDLAVQLALQERFEQIAFSHGRAARAEYYVRLIESATERCKRRIDTTCKTMLGIGGLSGELQLIKLDFTHSSPTMPKSTTSKPRPSTAARSPGRFASKTANSSCGPVLVFELELISRSSLPVLRSATRGLG